MDALDLIFAMVFSVLITGFFFITEGRKRKRQDDLILASFEKTLFDENEGIIPVINHRVTGHDKNYAAILDSLNKIRNTIKQTKPQVKAEPAKTEPALQEPILSEPEVQTLEELVDEE